MKHRISRLVLVSALGLGGVTTGLVAAPAIASAATTGATTASALSGRASSITDALAGLVTDGSLSQEQADEVATTLAETLPGGGDGHRGGGGLRSLGAAATTLGLSQDELRAALEGGQSLAEVAADQDVDRADLVAALVEAEQAHLAEHVADGTLTQAEADERGADVADRVAELVDRQGLPERAGHGGDDRADS